MEQAAGWLANASSGNAHTVGVRFCGGQAEEQSQVGQPPDGAAHAPAAAL